MIALLLVAMAAAGRASVRMGAGQAGLPVGRGRRAPRVAAGADGELPPVVDGGADLDDRAMRPERHAALVSALRGLNFDNTAVQRLRVDSVVGGPVRQVRGSHLVRVRPTALKAPELIATSSALSLLGLPASLVKDLYAPELLPPSVRTDISEYLSGNQLLPGADPCAAVYCGHQFGRYAGQLGDGAAVSLGEIVVGGEGAKHRDPSELAEAEADGGGASLPAETLGRWEVQLKGAGLTPFSRAADGRKVLRSSIREFLASEAMHALGIPTTRAAALVTSDSRVTRDASGKGQSRDERCAVLTRVARGFLRFGSFELCLRETDGRTGPSVGLEEEVLAPLFEYALERHYPHLSALPMREERAVALTREVAVRTARLVAAWQAVGFVHGVLNTDNMAVSGDTIDYGPFGFMDLYDPDYVPNTSDAAGRYSYKQQPTVCAWNVRRLARCLAPLLGTAAAARKAEEAAARAYWAEFETERRRRFRDKLGLLQRDEGAADDRLLASLLDVMQSTGADFTNVFRSLSRIAWDASESTCYRPPQVFDAVLEYCLAQCGSCEAMLKRAKPVFHPKALARLVLIAETEPATLAKFGLDVSVVERERGRAERRDALASVTPRDKRLADAETWRSWLHAYRLRLYRERATLVGELQAPDLEPAEAAALLAAAARRKATMDGANPRFVLRQHIAARVIERAENHDFVELRRVQEMLSTPYLDQGHTMSEKYASLPPDWSHSLVLT